MCQKNLRIFWGYLDVAAVIVYLGVWKVGCPYDGVAGDAVLQGTAECTRIDEERATVAMLARLPRSPVKRLGLERLVKYGVGGGRNSLYKLCKELLECGHGEGEGVLVLQFGGLPFHPIVETLRATSQRVNVCRKVMIPFFFDFCLLVRRRTLYHIALAEVVW